MKISESRNINPLTPRRTQVASFHRNFSSILRRDHQKNFLWASRLWVGRRKEPILGYVHKNGEKKNLVYKGLNKIICIVDRLIGWSVHPTRYQSWRWQDDAVRKNKRNNWSKKKSTDRIKTSSWSKIYNVKKRHTLWIRNSEQKKKKKKTVIKHELILHILVFYFKYSNRDKRLISSLVMVSII